MEGCISKPCRERSNRLKPLLGVLLVAGAMGRAADNAPDPAAGRVTAVRYWSLGDTTRIAIEVSSDFHFKYERLTNPDRLYFDLMRATPDLAHRTAQIVHVDDAIVKQIRVAETQPGVTRVVVDLQQPATLTTSQLNNPERLMIEVKAMEPAKNTPSDGKTVETSAIPPAKTPVVREAVRDVSVASPPSPVMAAVTPSPVSATPPAAKSSGSRPVEPPVKTGKITVTSPVQAGPVSAPAAEKTATLVAAVRVSEMLKVADPVKGESTRLGDSRTGGSKITDAKPAKVISSNIPSRGTSLENRAEVVPENAVPNPLANSTQTGGDALPPEPLGIEPLYHDDARHEDVQEVLPAKRGATEDRSLTRALGLKLGRVVIDPGHGGHDVGTHGPSGYFEKDLVLDVSKRLAALIQERMTSDVIMTRSDDTYVGLEERTRIANERKADLFLSIHANSSTYRAAAGVETYILNFTTSKTAMDLASRENAGSEMGIHDLQDLLQKIALRDKIDESHELASRLQTSLSVLSTHTNDAAKNRGVKKAPFVVLIGANMPSVLAEIGFLSNASDEALLRKPEHRQKIAEALFKGITSYADTLSQVIARQN